MSQQLELGPLTACQLQQIPIYALTAVTKFEKVAEFKGRKGNFIKGFLLNDLRNKNGWRTTWESIKMHYEDFINKPGTYFERAKDMPDHPDGETYKRMMSNQENYRVTNIVGLELDHKTHTLNYIAEVLDEDLTEIDFDTLLESGKINFTSPGVWPTEAEVLGHMPNGRPILDVHHWKALHYSYINDPAFGEEAAKTLGTCEGLGAECMTRLAASTNLEGNESLAPLMEVPLIRDKLNRIYTPCELKAFHAQLIGAEDDPAGQWITSNGKHIFIPEGENVENFVKQHFDNINKKESRQQKQKELYNTKNYNDDSGRIKIKVVEHAPEFGRHIEVMKDAWNNTPEADKVGIDKFFIGNAPSTSKNAAGTFNNKTNAVGIHLSNIDLKSDATDAQIKEKIEGIMTHEIAHSRYAKKFGSITKSNWSNDVMDAPPITGYLKKFRTKVIQARSEEKFQKTLRSAQFQEQDKIQKIIKSGDVSQEKISELRENINRIDIRIKKQEPDFDAAQMNHTILLNSYGNETHSEYNVLIRGQKTLWDSDMDAFEKIKPLYKKHFGSRG